MTLQGDKISSKIVTESYGKEKNRLAPTDIGMVVNDYLEAQFAMIMDYNFTANVEKEFDRIADGELQWVNMIETFYTPFHKMVDDFIFQIILTKYHYKNILYNDCNCLQGKTCTK